MLSSNLLKAKLQTYFKLMRIDKPIGILLLLWPTLCALWLASKTVPELKTLIVFILGVFFMRTAGCVINDYIDCKIDSHVRRTQNRVLPSGAISKRETEIIFGILIGVSFILVLMLNSKTILLSVVALALTLVYPFMKRYTYLPQLVLGTAFSWSIIMAFTAVNESLPLNCWLLFLSNITWTIAYDTQYAMIDRDDDLRIGVKSTAILFGRFDKLIVGLLQTITLALLCVIGWQAKLNNIYYLSLTVVAIFFFWQQKLIANRERQACFKAFMNNNFVGMLVFSGILLSLLPY